MCKIKENVVTLRAAIYRLSKPVAFCGIVISIVMTSNGCFTGGVSLAWILMILNITLACYAMQSCVWLLGCLLLVSGERKEAAVALLWYMLYFVIGRITLYIFFYGYTIFEKEKGISSFYKMIAYLIGLQ